MDRLDALAAKYIAPEVIPELETWPCGCSGRGWVVDLETRVAKPCSCRAEKSIEERLLAAGLTDRNLLGATWDGRRPPLYPSREGLSQFPMPKPCVTLLGPVGTGKGFTAACILRDWLSAGKRCRFVDVPDFVEGLLALELQDREPQIQALFEPDLVILDEFYTERPAPYGDEVVGRIVRRRCADFKALVLVTNLSKEKLEQADARSASRIFGSAALLFDFTDLPDRRRQESERAK